MNAALQLAITIGSAAMVQLSIAAFFYGRTTERVNGLVDRANRTDSTQGEHGQVLTNHERRISHLEGSKGIPLSDDL